MLLQSQHLDGANILSMHTGQVVGRLGAAIINPHKLVIEGYYCEVPQKLAEMPVLLTQDIRQASGHKVYIDSTDELTPPNQLLRHKQIMGLKFQLIVKTVRTASGKKLGKVEEYVINSDSWEIQKIYVKQSLLKNFSAHSLIIDRSQVVEVNDQEVVVDDALAGKPVVATPPAT